MNQQPSAPPVVAVVVAHEPGPWFEETLAALGAQDYPNQSVLVIDAGSATSPAPRIAATLPDAYLRRLEGNPTFGAVANDTLATVQGAAFLLFCHDDVAPDPDAVRMLVEEALRSNAGVVAPKLVSWDDPTRLLEVGLAVDKTGADAPLVERGELDQEQHDAVRDVFAVSSSCMLMRGDLFSAMRGFDTVMGEHSGDIDLCWRAQVAGARVIVAPAARVRHLEAHGDARSGPDHGHFERRHQLRAMLKNYSLVHLVRVAPQAALVTLVETVLALAGRRWREARSLLSAWLWNLRHIGELWPLRRRVQRSRAVPDAEIRRLQVRGSVRLSSYLRRRLHAEDRAEAILTAGQRLVGSFGSTVGRAAAILLAILVLAVLVGSRHLLTGRVPAVGQLAPFPRPSTLLTHAVDGWRTTGLGAVAPAPPAMAILGLGGLVALGKMGLLQTLVIMAAWPVGAIGMWRLASRFASTLARLVGVIAYLAVPVPYNAVARGRLGALVAFAAAPWLLDGLARLAGAVPLSNPDDEPTPARLRLEMVKLGIATAVVSAFAPAVGVALLVAAVGLFGGSVLVRQVRTSGRAVVGAVVAVAISAVLLIPWSLSVLRPRGWTTVVGVARDPARALGWEALLRFQTGPMGAAPLGFALLVAAALPLVVGREWRFAWGVRFWVAGLSCIAVAWASGRGWGPVRLQSPDVVLAVAAAAFAGAVAMGAASFELDVPGYRFGWRQIAPFAAGTALVVTTLPVLASVDSGRWDVTHDDVARSLRWMRAETGAGAFRVLWLGDPEVLPLDAWPLADGIAYATSRNGPPDVTDLLPGAPSAATRQIAGAVRVAQRGDTARLGRLLAPMAVRYVVVAEQLSVMGQGPRLRVPDRLTNALVSQIDLRLLPGSPGVAVYENTAWGATRTLLPDGLATEEVPESLSGGADLSGGRSVLPGDGPVRYHGRLPENANVLVSESPSRHWALRVDGSAAVRSPAYGVANIFRSSAGGDAELRFRPPPLHYLWLVAQIAVWAIAIRAVVGLRRRDRRQAELRAP